jgi:outer membrane protein assembly factor BamB
VLFGALVALLPGCWLQVGFDAGHTRHNDAEEDLTLAGAGSLTETWSVDLGPRTAEPMVRGDRVYLTTGGFDPSDGSSSVGAAAHDVATGAEAWQRTFVSFCCAEPTVEFAAPAFVDHQMWASYLLLYVQGRPYGGFGGPVRVDPVEGHQIAKEEHLVASSPAEADGAVVQLLLDATLVPRLVVRDLPGLAVRWTAEQPRRATPTPFRTPPVVVDGTVVVSGFDGVRGYPLAGCGAPTCPASWQRTDLGEEVTALAARPGHGDVLAVAGDELVALALDTGATRWSAPLGAAAAGLAVTADTVYVGSAATLRAFPAGGCGDDTCEPEWTAALGTSATSAPTVAGDAVYVGGAGVVEVFAAGGCGAAACPSSAAVPVDGTVDHVVVSDGRLFAVSRPAGRPSRLTAYEPAA